MSGRLSKLSLRLGLHHPRHFHRRLHFHHFQLALHHLRLHHLLLALRLLPLDLPFQHVPPTPGPKEGASANNRAERQAAKDVTRPRGGYEAAMGSVHSGLHGPRIALRTDLHQRCLRGNICHRSLGVTFNVLLRQLRVLRLEAFDKSSDISNHDGSVALAVDVPEILVVRAGCCGGELTEGSRQRSSGESVLRHGDCS